MKVRSPYDVQVVRRRKPRETVYIRAVPRTIFEPTRGQVLHRLRVARAGRKARGKKGLCPCHGLPWAAHYVLTELKGKRVPPEVAKKPREPEWVKRLRAFARIHRIPPATVERTVRAVAKAIARSR